MNSQHISPGRQQISAINSLGWLDVGGHELEPMPTKMLLIVVNTNLES